MMATEEGRTTVEDEDIVIFRGRRVRNRGDY